MRLALVFPGCHRRAGVERIVWECARHLARKHGVTVVAGEWEECGVPGIRYERVGAWTAPRFVHLLSFPRRARRILSTLPYERLLSFGVNCPVGDIHWVSSVHRAWLERSRTLPNGLRTHPLRRFLPHHQIVLAQERACFRQRCYRRVITVSDRVAEDLGRLYQVPREDMVTIPNGYDPAQFSPERCAALRSEARAEIGLPGDALALLMVANELHRKGFGILLEAAARVGDPRLHIVVAGRASPQDYRAQIRSSGLSERVHYVGPVADVGRIHAAADLFVLPTQYEAFCVAIVEALASGLPVITTNVPGAADTVQHGLNGLIQQDPMDSAELAGLLQRALDVGERRAWCAIAPETVRAYQWPLLMARAEVVLEGL